MRERHPDLLLLTLLLSGAASSMLGAATEPASHWCGTSPSGLEIDLAQREYFERHIERERRAGRLSPAAKSHDTVRQVGEVAVIEDDGTLFIQPKPVDLQGQSMQFLRRPKGVSAVRSHLDFKSVLGTRLDLDDDDSFLVEFPPGFQYPFGERTYSSVYVNSDGNLTFGESDTAITPRSLARFLDGPPRLAPLFTDLNPEAARGSGGIYLNFLPGRVRVTWLEIPRFGTSNKNTVQVTLFTTGRATFVYGPDVETDEAIVGVNPWAGAEPLHLMNYNEDLPFRPQKVSIAEWFPAQGPEVDAFSIAFRFFQNFHDVYDELVVWYDFDRSLGTNVLAQSRTIQNEVQGIGENLFDLTPLVGSQGRLRSFVEMGGSVLDDYPDHPDDPLLSNGETTMSLVGHEVGHRWLARVRFRDPRDGDLSDNLLGRQMAHWSFFMDSDASLLEGNQIRDNNDGTFITERPVAIRYSALDQYLMGLIPPEDVPPFFFIDNARAGIFGKDSNPRGGVTISGNRVDLRISDIIAAEGTRVPAASEAPKSFNVAFILVGGPGAEVSDEAIAKTDRFRARFEEFFSEATEGRGEVRTRLEPR